MNLLTRTALYHFILSLLVIAVGLVGFYAILQGFVSQDATENLYIQRQRLQRELPLIDSIPDNSSTVNNAVRFVRLPDGARVSDRLKDTMIYETFDRDYVPYRILTTSARTRSYNYKIIIYQSMIESDHLILRIAKSLARLLIIYLILLVIINRFIVSRIWRPFYETLHDLRSFDLLGSNQVGTKRTNINEFNALNEALHQMTEKIRSDYRNLKEFTENASHEIQTPLAIIRSKIELMLQAENISEAEYKNLHTINEAAGRLSKLNQSLLLLSKIENGQFNNIEPVNLTEALDRQLENLNELIAAKGITMRKEIEPQVMICVHPYLLDILLSNLLMNAVRHNVSDGFITIQVKKGWMFIQNSGVVLNTDPRDLFSRFKKGNSDSDSIGIGLSLVQKIAESNSIVVSYSYLDRVHTIELKF